MLIFPTISLLSENYLRLFSLDESRVYFEDYEIHSLSDIGELGRKNIWVFTPERFLSYIDKSEDQAFDFVFIDEIYKIDNEYIIDKETTGENERDTAYRIALEYSCRKSKDILLAGPYLEFSNGGKESNQSFGNFVSDKHFEILDYNSIEIVGKTVTDIKSRLEYEIDGINIEVGSNGVYKKVANIINALTTTDNRTILYYKTKAGTEKYAKELIPLLSLNSQGKKNESKNGLFNMFITHLEKEFGEDWIVVRALKSKIGIHHGLVPKYIQKQIIELFNLGELLILISTTTITEGVNTAAKNIIVCSHKKGIKNLKHFDAKNIAGRAGRFSYHYRGRVVVINNDFKKILEDENEQLKHKNFDEDAPKNDIDYQITDDKYLKQKEILDRESIEIEIQRRGISSDIINQFKVVSKRDKLLIYDKIKKMTSTELSGIGNLIIKVNSVMKIDWDGFQIILNTIRPIIRDEKLGKLIDRKCKNTDGTESCNSIITAKTHYYLKGGFKGLLDYTLKKETKDSAIRNTAEMVYNIFKYQLNKYLGVFDLMYKCVMSQKQNKDFDDVIGITKLSKKLEYNALNENARIISDFGVPFKLIEFYDDENNINKKQFDNYEHYIDEKIVSLLK